VARFLDVVIDCARPAVVARFWAAALDGYAVAPYDDEERTRLRSIGIDDPEDDPTVLVEGPVGSPRLWCQQVRRWGRTACTSICGPMTSTPRWRGWWATAGASCTRRATASS